MQTKQLNLFVDLWYRNYFETTQVEKEVHLMIRSFKQHIGNLRLAYNDKLLIKNNKLGSLARKANPSRKALRILTSIEGTKKS